MARRSPLLLACLVSLAPSACFLANSSTSTKVGEVVDHLNDETRWGRIDDAAMMVDPEYRDRFLERHRAWGSDIQLADSEVVHIQIASDATQASAFVNYSWYAMRDMTLHETTLRQLWSAKNRSFALSSESVVRGDPGLFSPPADEHAAATVR